MPNSLWLRYLWYFQQFLLTAEEEDCRSCQDLWAGSTAFDQDRKRDTIYIYIYNILKQFNPPYILLSYIHFFPGRNCEYGGEEEYYVTTRETGALEQNRLKKDERKEITKDLRSLNWLDPQLHVCRFIPT